MSGSSDLKTNTGLANSLSNVFKLADVNGLKWIRYLGPNSACLEAPKADPVLNSYARLLNEGYACSWRRLSPSTDGLSGEAKDLWLFFFTDHLSDISEKLAEGLLEKERGGWEDGMTTESSTMLYRSLHNIIERSLMNEHYLPLGKWFAKPDSSVATDGSTRGCFLCSFSFFVHAHLYICASVDMRAGPHLQPLLPTHINQALESSTGLQVILSPSGLNAVMTGHSYKMSDTGIDDILEEWRLFYPRRFALDPSPNLPAAIEVLLGGVRVRYPSQFVFVYHGDENAPSPPRCVVNDHNLDETIHETWDTARCINTVSQQKLASQCRCQDPASSKGSQRRLSSHLELPLKTGTSRHGTAGRYHPYSNTGGNSMAKKAKELATPGSLNLMNIPHLNVKRKLSRFGMPKYTTPLSSPALPMVPLSPTAQGKMGGTPGSVGAGGSGTVPIISVSSGAPSTSVSHGYSTCEKFYDQSRLPPGAVTSLTFTKVSLSPTSGIAHSPHQQLLSPGLPPISRSSWWDALDLPESYDSMATLLSYDTRHLTGRRSGLGSLSPGTPTLTELLTPNSKKVVSPNRRGRNSIDHLTLTKSTSSPIGTSTSHMLVPGDRPGTPSSATKLHPLPIGGRGRLQRDGDPGVPVIGGIGTILTNEDGYDCPGMDSPMSHNGELHQANGELLLDGGFGSEKSKPQIDVFSDRAVKIDEGGLDQIFASDEEDESQEGVELTQFTFGDGRTGASERVDHSNNHKVSKAEPMSISELSRIYPTPPSVETNMDREADDEIKEDRTEHTCLVNSTDATQWNTSYDDECVPMEFAPLPELMSLTQTLPKQCVYVRTSTASSGGSNKTSGNDINTSRTTSSIHSEPQKFIFPPPTSLASRATPRENLTLPLTKQTRFSPNLFPHHPSATLTSSPAHILSKSGGSGPAGSWFSRHLTTPSLLTPLESPFENVTPTPLSATTNNRLMPVLPEAHGLYINLALLDSAIGTNLSETLPISAGSLMNSLSRFMQFNSKRMKLDSIAESTSALDTDATGSTDLLNCQDEKPLMTFGIADYPSLGFEEELGVGGMTGMADVGGSTSPLGAVSKFISELTGEPQASNIETVMANFPLMKFLELLQDYCLHLCFSGYQDSKNTHHGIVSHRDNTHLMLRPTSHLEESHDLTSCKLYHSHSVVSAVLNAKQLVVSAGRRCAGGSVPSNKPTSVTLNKEDNSGAWILDLLTLPTKFLTKRLKELRSVFQSSFNQTPCLKFSTKGPLTLKDLQQLKPSQTAISDECAPLPITPVVVGHDHEWLSVSPLSLPAWDKLLFEPYALRKNVAYLVVIPPNSISPSTSNISKALKNYFRDLSITFKNCQLGQHVPLEKGIGVEGILLASGESSTAASDTDDANTSTRHGAPVGLTDLSKFCKKVVATYLSSLPSDNEELLTTCAPSFMMSHDPANNHHTTHQNSSHLISSSTSSSNSSSVNRATHPLSIVLYVLCDSLLLSSSNNNQQSQDERLRSFHILRALSEMLMDEEIPDFIRNKLLLQLIDPKELLGPSSGRCGQLRSLAFSVYSRCRPAFNHLNRARTLTSFGPTAEREGKKNHSYRQVYAPPFILSPEPPLSGSGPILGTQIHPILFDPDEAVLFCGYCVSPDQRWMLVVCCDRQGELLDTSVIGIPHSTSYDVDQSRGVALQKLWMFLTSVVSGSVFRWSLVITRFGKPGNSEIRDWPGLIPDDGLLTANQVLCGDCSACSHTSCHPHFSNVIVVSVQPERNIQLFPNNDPNPAVSHVMVLPLDPRAAAAVACTTPSATDAQNVDVMELFGGGDSLADPLGMDGIGGLDLGSELSGINIGEEFQNSQLGYTPAVEDTTPKATGYLISTLPPGDLPKEFWGHERPQTCCSMFKVLLHCHRSEKLADSPQETLASTLLCFDALSWLTMDHTTRQRRTCLPMHLYVLAKLYKMFSLLNHSER